MQFLTKIFFVDQRLFYPLDVRSASWRTLVRSYRYSAMKDKTYLFAYGTLRRGFDIGVKNEIEKELVFIGTGKVKARLYDLGDYPGAIKTNDEAEIEGDLFEVLNEEETFKILDDYEGDEYERALTTIKMNANNEVDAWIYWYKGEINEHKRIINKDYRSYLTTNGND